VTVFEGDSKDDTTMDEEAFSIWKSIVEEDRIIMGNKKDNFWELGSQGPCGPCSEIHVDIRSDEEKAKTPGNELVNKDHPHVIEIWNLVFMQYNRKADGSLEDLPLKHIDTGMGFERLCMVLQGVQSNYDTDIFTPIIREIEAISGKDYGGVNQMLRDMILKEEWLENGSWACIIECPGGMKNDLISKVAKRTSGLDVKEIE